MIKTYLNLDDDRLTFENAGNKAYMLSKVQGIVPVPKGFVITTGIFENFIKKNNLAKVIDKAILDLLDKKISAKEASIQIKTAIQRSKMEGDDIKEVYNRISGLTPPFAVRSSCTGEDSLRFSFAGLCDSFLDVGLRDLIKKIKAVYASLYNERAIEYAYRNGIDLRDLKMGVLIQEMVKGDKFGVGFYFKNYSAEIAIIESVIQKPWGVTSGKLAPDTYLIRNNNKINKYPQKINHNVLFDFELDEIFSFMKKLKCKAFPLDIEWGFEQGKLWLLQLRPLTKKVPFPKGNELLAGLPSSSGKICGRVTIWDKKKRGKLERGKDKILIAEEIEIDDVDIIKDFGGVVLEVSGTTAHASILARELGIPCIVGVDGITKLVNSGEKICIDGDKGKITFLERESFSIERKYRPIYIDPKRLKYFRLNKNMILYLNEKKYSVIYHAGLKNELKEICTQLNKKIRKPLIDGGVDIWYGYGSILEMSQLKKEIYSDFLYALTAIESTNQKKILKIIKQYEEKIEAFYKEAEGKFKLYSNTKNRKDLKDALQSINFAYAYWKIIGHCMLYDYAENVINRGIRGTKGFLRFIVKMEGDKTLTEIGDKVVDLTVKILETIKKDLNLDYSLYTAGIALMSSIDKSKS